MTNEKISEAILAAARERGPFKSTCPSEVARDLFPENWREHMQDIRDTAVQLSHEGKVRIMQRGEQIDTAHIKGPIRIQIV